MFRERKRQQKTAIFGTVFLVTILGLVLVTVNAVPALAQISPLHAGTGIQQKKGTLRIGSGPGSARLCLNDDASTISDDATNCISDWGVIANTTEKNVTLTLDRVHVFNAITTDGKPDVIIGDQLPEYGSPQFGYINLKGGVDQKFTAILKAPDINFCEDIDEGFGSCAYTHTQCTSNKDCLYGPDDSKKNVIGTALYGAGSDESYAGYFGGTVWIKSLSSGSPDGEICLKGSCQSSWNSISATQFVKRQAGSLPTAQAYGAQITGVAFFSSAVIGQPVTSDAPITYSCGNGLCEANESAIPGSKYCPADCSPAPADPPQSGQTMSSILGSTSSSPKVQLHLTAGAPQTGNVTLLVVRSKLAPTTWSPVNGTIYTAGTVMGNTTIVAVLPTTSGGRVDFLDQTLNQKGDFATGTKYYYQVYQANASWRYSLPTSPMELRLFKATLMINIAGAASYEGLYANYPGNPEGLYMANTTDTFTVSDRMRPYCPAGWTGCDSSNNNETCTVRFNSDRVIELRAVEILGSRTNCVF